MDRHPVPSLGASVEVFYIAERNRTTVPITEAVGSIVELGLGVELWTSNPDWSPLSQAQIETIRAMCESAPVVTAHTGLSEWQPQAIADEMRRSHAMGASILIVHGDTLGVGGTAAPPDYGTIRDLGQLALYLEMLLALENGYAGTHVLERTLEHVGHDPTQTGLGICVDVGHAHIAEDREQYSVGDYLRIFQDQLVHVHVHDVVAGRDHAVPGDGELAWAEILPLLSAIGFEGCLMLELLHPGDPVTLIQRGQRFLAAHLSPPMLSI